MKVTATMTTTGLLSCLAIFCFCILRMEHRLRNAGLIPTEFNFFLPFLIFSESRKIIQSNSKDANDFIWYHKMIKSAVILTPILIGFGLLIFAIAKK